MLRLLLILCGVFALTGWLGLERIERALVYPFESTRVRPADAGLSTVRAVEFVQGDETLIVWTAQPAAGKPIIFYLHGNAGGLQTRAGRFRRFLDRGYGLVAPAYRGSSGSSGTPSQETITADVRAVWSALPDLIPGQAPVVVYGESLGTGVAVVALLSDIPGTPAAGAILEAPFTSLPDVARNAYPKIDPLVPRMQNIWASIDAAPSVMVPLLVVHGTKDTLIPIEQGRAVFDAAGSPTKRFLAVTGAGHTDLWRSDVMPDIWHFIDRHGR